MEELISSADLTEGEEDGEFDNDYKWYIKIEPAEMQPEEDYQSLPLELYELTVRVSWLGDGKERNLELNTLKSVAK